MQEAIFLEKQRSAVREGRIEWQRHCLERMLERGLSRSEIVHVLLQGERIEDYPSDRPLPSGLFFGHSGSRALHVVVAFDVSTEKAFIITAYEPNLEQFQPDLRTRRKK